MLNVQSFSMKFHQRYKQKHFLSHFMIQKLFSCNIFIQFIIQLKRHFIQRFIIILTRRYIPIHLITYLFIQNTNKKMLKLKAALNTYNFFQILNKYFNSYFDIELPCSKNILYDTHQCNSILFKRQIILYHYVRT